MKRHEIDPSVEMGKAAYGFFNAFVSEQKNKLKDFFSKNKVGFLPPGLDFMAIKKAQEKQSFKQLKYLIGNHQTLPIISVGIWLDCLPEEEQKKIAAQIRDEIYQEHKKRGVNILNMTTTGYIHGFIKFLTNLSLEKDIAKDEMIDIYERTLENWENITFFVKSDHSKKSISEAIKLKLSHGFPFIYVFASYSVIPKTEDCVSKLLSGKLPQAMGYSLERANLDRDNNKAIWIFEKGD